MDDLMNQVRRLHEARERYADAKAVLDAAKYEWEQQHMAEIEEIAKAAGERDAIEGRLRTMAVAAYKETGERKPAPGVEVKMFDTIDYNREAAFEWAKEHGLALRLDDAAFRNIAKAQKLPCVRYGTEPKATVATDLGKVVDGEARHGS